MVLARTQAVVALLLWSLGCTPKQDTQTTARLDEARAAHEQGERLKREGQYDAARASLERALELRERVLGQENLDVATTRCELADVQDTLGEYAQARAQYEWCARIRERLLGARALEVAQALNGLAVVHGRQGEFDAAQTAYERARSIWEEKLGSRHINVARVLNNLGGLHVEQGHYREAEALLTRAVSIRREVLGSRHVDTATSLQNLAIVYNDQELFTRAEPLLREALSILEKQPTPQPLSLALVLQNLGALYRDEGLYEQAEPLLRKAVDLRIQTLGDEHHSVASAISNLGILYYNQGRYGHDTRMIEKARPFYERALSIRKKTLGEHHPAMAASLYNLALLDQAEGHFAQAQSQAERALSIRKEVFGEHHSELAENLGLLANLEREQRHFRKALKLAEQALALQREQFGEQNSSTATALNHVAVIELALNRPRQALPRFMHALSISEKCLRQEMLDFSESRLSSMLTRAHEDAADLLYTFVLDHPNDASVQHLALTQTLLHKGRSLKELSKLTHLLSQELKKEDLKRFERLRELRTEFSTVSFLGAGAAPLSEHQHRLRQLATQADELERLLAQRSASLRALRALPAPEAMVEHVRRALPKDSALVEFVAYHDDPSSKNSRKKTSRTEGTVRYLAILLLPDGRTQALDLGRAAVLDGATSRLHEALASSSPRVQARAQELYRLTLGRLRPWLGKTRRLFVAPDGPLALVPFATLHDGQRFLLDRFEFTYLTSGRDLLPRPSEPSAQNKVVVVANPTFEPTPGATEPPAKTNRAVDPSSAEALSTRTSTLSLRWNPLPGSGLEAQDIQRVFPRATLFLGPAATKNALMDVDSPALLHIATHGFFLPDDSPVSPDTRTVDSSVGQPETLAAPEEPLLRSGLVFAGASALADTPRDQVLAHSFATALELGGLDLWGTRLVVLSACDTALGDVAKLGQGVYGLRRAFLMAGAETLVSSLWPINDQNTRAFMAAFYRHLLRGEGRVEALHSAMRERRRVLPHPHDWAPFIAIGSGAPLPPELLRTADAPRTGRRPAPHRGTSG